MKTYFQSMLFNAVLAGALLLTTNAAQAQHFPFGQGKSKPNATAGAVNSQAKINALVSRPGTSQDYSATSLGSWQLDAISTYTYDAQGRLTQRVYADPTTNQHLAKENISYDAYGNESLYKFEQWNGVSWDVMNAYKIQSTYNAQGLKTEEIHQNWDTFGGIWENEGKTVTTYDASNRAMEITNLEWDNNAWVQVDRMVLNHVNGTATSALMQEYDGGSWQDVFRAQNLTWHVLYEIPMAYTLEYYDNGTWVNGEKYLAVYDANGGHVGTYQQWEATANLWVNSSRETESYDNNRNFTGWEEEMWDAAASGWVYNGEEQEVLTYSGIDITERIFRDSWNSTQTLQDQRKEVYSNFQTFNISGVKKPFAELAVNVYPNPATDRIRIDFADQKHTVSATLVDVTGKTWLTKSFKATEAKQLNLEAMPKGVYLLQLQTEAGSTVKRIVKQ